MMSREEMHRQKQQADASVKQPRHHHFGAAFLGILLTMVIAIAVLRLMSWPIRQSARSFKKKSMAV